MIKEMQNKASTNTVHLMNQLAASSPTPSKTVLIPMKLHLLPTRCYERGKRKKKIQKADCKYFAWQLLSCHWEVVKVEEREEERSFTVTTLIAVDVILSVSSGSRDSEPVLKWYWKCTQCFSSPELQVQHMEGLLVLRTYFHHLCVLEWRKKRQDVFPYHTLFIPCLFVGFAPTRAAKVREESSNRIELFGSAHCTHHWSGIMMGIQHHPLQ